MTKKRKQNVSYIPQINKKGSNGFGLKEELCVNNSIPSERGKKERAR